MSEITAYTCTKCGAPVDPKFDFCPYCGTHFHSKSSDLKHVHDTYKYMRETVGAEKAMVEMQHDLEDKKLQMEMERQEDIHAFIGMGILFGVGALCFLMVIIVGYL